MAYISQEILDGIFPASRTDDFFDALYGDAEDGAYDIRLVCENADANTASMAFELKRRPNQCLKCSLTYGLPQVFARHPVIDMEGTAQAVAKALGWEGHASWRLGATREMSDNLHTVPFTLTRS